MKIKLLMLLSLIPTLISADNIKPLTILRAGTTGGTSARKYVVVHTTILKNPNVADSKPIVDRAVINVVPCAVIKTLKVPQMLTDLQAGAGVNINQISGMVSQSIGKVGAQIPDPKVKAAAAAASLATGTLGLLADTGMRIAGKLMDKYYGKQNTFVSMIEILPEDYYTVDRTTGEVKVSQKFENDLEKLVGLQAQYQPALQAFNDAYLKFNKEVNKALIEVQDASEEEEAAIYEKIELMKHNLEPLARAKVEIEAKLANLQLYRVALMAWNLPKMGSCGGAGSGPALLRLFVFLGAKQTNVYDIPYCAPNPNTDLHANIEFVLPYFDNNGAYHDGGVRLVCPDGTINFQGLTASQDLAFRYAATKVYNFYDSMITGEGAGYDQYLIPWDILNLQSEIKAAINEAEAKKDAAAKEQLTSMLTEYEAAMNKAKAEGFTGFNFGKKSQTVPAEPAVEPTPAPQASADATPPVESEDLPASQPESEPEIEGPVSAEEAEAAT